MDFKVPVGISNRHVHLTKEIYDQLFSNELEKDRNTKQIGEYASTSYVNLIGPKGRINHVRVMGPLRDYNQVEISYSDAYLLGLNPPVRKSKDLKNAEDIVIEVNEKQIELKEACILAESHIHMNQEDLEKYHLKEDEIVEVIIDHEQRKGSIMAHIKSKDSYVKELHIDRDEANAFLIQNGEELTVRICSK